MKNRLFDCDKTQIELELNKKKLNQLWDYCRYLKINVKNIMNDKVKYKSAYSKANTTYTIIIAVSFQTIKVNKHNQLFVTDILF